jgi:hypothetical protein
MPMTLTREAPEHGVTHNNAYAEVVDIRMLLDGRQSLIAADVWASKDTKDSGASPIDKITDIIPYESTPEAFKHSKDEEGNVTYLDAGDNPLADQDDVTLRVVENWDAVGINDLKLIVTTTADIPAGTSLEAILGSVVYNIIPLRSKWGEVTIL